MPFVAQLFSRRSSVLAMWSLMALAAPGHAQTLPTCEDLPNPIFMRIANTQRAFMQRLGRVLADRADPITLVYTTGQSCPNTDDFFNSAFRLMAGSNAFYVPSTAEDAAWEPGTFVECTFEADQPLALSNSVILIDQCGYDQEAPPDGIGLFEGPVQPYGLVVPEASSQRAITAEAAYLTFGFPDGEGGASPWNDDAFKAIMAATAGTQVSIAQSIRVPQAKWYGTSQMTPAAVRDAVIALGAQQPEKTLGILASELYDPARDQLNMLAFQAYDQDGAYVPDSTPDALDKRNVRDGHYVLWSPTVWMVKVDGAGAPVSDDVAYLLDSILGKVSGHADALAITSQVSLVPDCAMQVQRSAEGGPLSRYVPAEPCGCFFEAAVTQQTPAHCAQCSDTEPCAEGTCLRGYCETTPRGLYCDDEVGP